MPGNTIVLNETVERQNAFQINRVARHIPSMIIDVPYHTL